MASLVSNWWARRASKLRDWYEQIRAKHQHHNEHLQNRQARRQRLFAVEMEHMNFHYGGEPRKARRGMARVRAKNEWREHVKGFNKINKGESKQ